MFSAWSMLALEVRQAGILMISGVSNGYSISNENWMVRRAAHIAILAPGKANRGTTIDVNVYGFLTIPEDARIGVSAHEIGHLRKLL